MISVLWVKRPKDGMSTAYQFAVLTTALLKFDIELSRHSERASHCGVGSVSELVNRAFVGATQGQHVGAESVVRVRVR
jgi:hypothetical protein